MVEESSEDLKDKSKKALKAIVQMCTHLSALEPLLTVAPPNIMKYIVEQFAKTLPQNIEYKRSFLQSGGFQTIQKIKAAPGSKLREFIDEINNQFPPEIVQYYSPDYATSLLKKLEDYH